MTEGDDRYSTWVPTHWPYYWAMVALLIGIFCSIVVAEMDRPRYRDSQHVAESQLKYPPRTANLPGVKHPKLVTADEVIIRDEDLVIGVSVGGESHCYLGHSFDQNPNNHLVLDRIGSTFLVVTHCDRNRCTRVLKNNGATDVRLGGWDGTNLVLLLDDVSYAQDSDQIPLDEIPFVVTTWKTWHDTHPDTVVYTGENKIFTK